MDGGKGMYPEVKLSHPPHLPCAGWYAPCEENKRRSSLYSEVGLMTSQGMLSLKLEFSGAQIRCSFNQVGSPE